MTQLTKNSLVVIFSLLAQGAFALDIPLSGVSESKAGAKVAFVDLDRIYQIFPQTQNAKEDYAKQLAKKKEQLAGKESELVEIKNRMAVLEATIKGSSPDSTSQAQPTSLEALTKMKQDLDTKKSELEELKKQASADLKSFQNQQSQLILGKIYQALRDLANEEQVTLVVDKTSILYGEPNIDLTDKLQERVRGY